MTRDETTNMPAGTDGAKTAGKPRQQPRTTKKEQLVRLLGRKGGADIATISRKLGWQQHTTRAALTGLRKSGFEIGSEKPAGVRASRYRIIAEPRRDAV